MCLPAAMNPLLFSFGIPFQNIQKSRNFHPIIIALRLSVVLHHPVSNGGSLNWLKSSIAAGAAMQPLNKPAEALTPSPPDHDQRIHIKSAPGSGSGAGSSAAGGGTRKWATEDDFNKYRAVITELYDRETLSQLMQIMQTKYNFMAT